MPDSMTNVLEVLAERKGKGGSEQISKGSREEMTGGIGGAFGETGPQLRLLPGAQEAGREEMTGK